MIGFEVGWPVPIEVARGGRPVVLGAPLCRRCALVEADESPVRSEVWLSAGVSVDSPKLGRLRFRPAGPVEVVRPAEVRSRLEDLEAGR